MNLTSDDWIGVYFDFVLGIGFLLRLRVNTITVFLAAPAMPARDSSTAAAGRRGSPFHRHRN